LEKYLEDLALCCVKGVFKELEEIYWTQKAWARLYEVPNEGVVYRLKQKIGIDKVIDAILENLRIPNNLKLETTFKLLDFYFSFNKEDQLENRIDMFRLNSLFGGKEHFPCIKILNLLSVDRFSIENLLKFYSIILDGYSTEPQVRGLIERYCKNISDDYLKIIATTLIFDMVNNPKKNKIILNCINDILEKSLISNEYYEKFLINHLIDISLKSNHQDKVKKEGLNFYQVINELFSKEKIEDFTKGITNAFSQYIEKRKMNIDEPVQLLFNIMNDFLFLYNQQIVTIAVKILLNRAKGRDLETFIFTNYDRTATSYSFSYSLNLGLLHYIQHEPESLTKPFVLKFLKMVIKSNNGEFRKRGYNLLFKIFRDPSLLEAGLKDRAKVVRNKVQKLMKKLEKKPSL